MPLHHEGLSSSNKVDQLNPSSQPDISPASTYSFLPDSENPSYVSLPHFSAQRAELPERTNDEMFSPGTVPPRYPESSQRTFMHKGSYITGYDLDPDGRRVDEGSVHEGGTTVYKDYMDAGLNQGSLSLRIPPATHRASVTERPVMYIFPEESRTPLTHSPPGSAKPIFLDEAPYSGTDGRPRPGTPPFSSSLEPQRPRIPPTSPHQIGRHSSSQFGAPSVLIPGDGLQYARYDYPGSHTSQPPNATTHPPFISSIPMRNSPGVWSSAPLGSASEAHPPFQRLSKKALKRSSNHTTPDPDPDPSVSYVGHSIPDIPLSSSSATSSLDPPNKKRKSKMHECEVCGKQFPRPSGLQTHMNTHNNVKPFPCIFPGCQRTFAVRSNATRHLRTHGTIPPPHPSSAPYVVNFDTPTVMPSSSTSSHEMTTAPYKLRWMPPSLTSRTNARTLTSMSDTEYDSDENMEVSGSVDWRSALSIPLPPVIPSSHTSDINILEERNSFLVAKPFPYHPLQFTVLPGPAIYRPTSASHCAV